VILNGEKPLGSTRGGLRPEAERERRALCSQPDLKKGSVILLLTGKERTSLPRRGLQGGRVKRPIDDKKGGRKMIYIPSGKELTPCLLYQKVAGRA